MIQIDHGNGITTRYGHLSGFAVAHEQSVRRGQVIGYVGLSGRTTGPNLYYEVRIHDVPVNPQHHSRAGAGSGELASQWRACISHSRSWTLRESTSGCGRLRDCSFAALARPASGS
jgi:hypothetical protein